MSDARTRLREQYGALVDACLANDDEAALSQAYELGRHALHAGLGILDVASLHQEAESKLALTAEGADQARALTRLRGLFHELLSPFEMTFRGYREANVELRRLNGALVQQKEAAELAHRELESFSYSVSHDLRAPLRRIDGFSQALLEDYGESLDAQGKRYLAHVRESAQHMAELIEGLLDLARVARSDLVRTVVDLTAAARCVVARLRAADPGRAVEVAVADAVTAVGDARLLAIVLDNLLGNAWKFTSKREDGRIAFGQRTEGGRVVYFVEDNGAGFDVAYSAKLFGVFQRLHAASEFDGTGIGLATVQRIVHRHGGQVWARGEVDRGATFSFTLGGGRIDP